jgi:hypothetical protein
MVLSLNLSRHAERGGGKRERRLVYCGHGGIDTAQVMQLG